MKKKIVCIHVFNNFTGSPNVLATVIDGLFNENYDVTLLTSLNSKGFLSDVNCKQKINISYVFKKNTVGRLVQFLKFQIVATMVLLKNNKDAIVYLNTIQPFLDRKSVV